MITEEYKKHLVEDINRKFGTRLKVSSKALGESISALNRFVPDAEYSMVYDYVVNKLSKRNPSKDLPSTIYEIAKNPQVLQPKNTRPNPEEAPKDASVKDVTFGLLEQALATVMVDKYAPKLTDIMKNQLSEWVANTYGKVERQIEYIIPNKGKLEETTHEQFETVLTYVMADEPVMLVGPAGTGKNVICKQIAKLLDTDFYFSNAITQEYKLTGFTDATGHYQPSQFYEAFTKGGLFLLDEIDASIPEVLVILNAAIANRYFDFPAPIGKVDAHPDFRVIAGSNTFGTGADYTYSGRYQLDGASLDRFAVIEIGYSEAIENSITDDKDLLDFFRKFRKVCGDNGVNHIVSYRSLKRIEKLKNTLDHKTLLHTALLKNLEKDDLSVIVKSFHGNNLWEKDFVELVNNM